MAKPMKSRPCIHHPARWSEGSLKSACRVDVIADFGFVNAGVCIALHHSKVVWMAINFRYLNTP
jgi:hypothetical protein